MKYYHIIKLLFCIFLPVSLIAQDIPEGGEALISKEQAKLFKDSKRVEALFFDAIKAKVTDNPGEAVHLFTQVTEMDPSYDAAWYELGLLSYRQRDINGAIKNIARAYELNPQNEWYSITLACLYSQNAQFAEAVIIFENLYKQDPTDRSNAFELANLYIKMDKSDKALEIYNDMEKREGVNEEISLRKHHIYLSQGKKKKALEELEKLALANEYDSRIQSILAEFYMSNGMEDKALATYEKILSIDPENPYINISLADFYRRKGDISKSIQLLKTGFSNATLDANTKLQILATYYAQIESYAEIDKDILELSKILVEQHPIEPQVLAFRAQMLATQEKYSEALSMLKKVNEIDPGKYENWDNIMRITAVLEKYDSLKVLSQEAIELFPVQPMPYYFNAVAHYMLKDYEGVISATNKGIKLVFNNNRLMSDFHSMAGDAHHSLDQDQEAFKAYESALRFNPDNSAVLNNYAYYLSLTGSELDKAERMAVQANEISPENATYLDTYAWILYKKGRYSEALIQMDKVMKLDDNPSGTVLEHYGDILYKLNRIDEAVKWWKHAQEAGDGSDKLPAKINDSKLYE